jgi:hypothetical protein
MFVGLEGGGDVCAGGNVGLWFLLGSSCEYGVLSIIRGDGGGEGARIIERQG